MEAGDLVSRIYKNFRGVDFRGGEVSLTRSPDSRNMWKDYRETERIRTRPGMEKLEAFTEPVYGIFFYQAGNARMMLVHSGTKLYRIAEGARTELYQGLNPAESRSFIYNNIWYFKDGINYLCYDGENIGEVAGYIPTTSIGRKPQGGGTTYEDVNMLTGIRINTFLADGESTEYTLDSQGIDTDFAPVVKVNDAVVEDYRVDTSNGKIIFHSAPPAPDTDGQDNVSVKFKKTMAGYRERINRCTLLQAFDNRIFFSGNPDYPNVVWHCSLNDPSYCSDLDYYNEGMDFARVTGLAAGNNALWVFKEPSQANTTVFYHTPALDDEYGKVYPGTHSSIAAGCMAGAVNFNDDIVFFSERGMEAINGDVTTEQVLAHRSSLIDCRLTAETDYEGLILAEWEGYLLVFVKNHVYLADSRAMFTNGSHYEYEWFYWELEKAVTCTAVYEEKLYLGTEDGVYVLTDETDGIQSWWTTAPDKFDAPHYQKTTNKRGCVVEAAGDVTVYAKTNLTEFQQVGEYKDVSDYFVVKKKLKKFKDVQLKFISDTRFALESATLEAFVGSYIKR